MNASRAQMIVGPILNPRGDGSVDFIRQGAIACDDQGVITFVGPERDVPSSVASSRKARSSGIICPPFLDAHIHIPQHPIRGHFMDGVDLRSEHGRLIAGLNQNVFPAEARFADQRYATAVIDAFARDTLANGVIGGAAYVTVHGPATRIALERLGPFWSAGLVLMEMNCPDDLRVDPATVVDPTMRQLAEQFGRRFIVTDRFAVAVGSELRRRAVALAAEFGLRMQTHLNEQLREKELVEKKLYPDAGSYTGVYRRDGLLGRDPILAHCIHMRPAELDLVAQSGSHVAHCPTSNALLASGIMPLDDIAARGIDYAICTDVGASPTTSILAEMAQYLKVHAGRSARATPEQALLRATLAPAKMLGHDDHLGSFDVGKALSFLEIEPFGDGCNTADDAILTGLLGMTEADLHDPARRAAYDALEAVQLEPGPQLDLLERDIRTTAARLEHRVRSVTLHGEEVFRRSGRSTL